MSDREMLPCHEVIAQLWEYIDGELTPERRERIEEHLEMCSRCFPQYDFQRAYREFLGRQTEQPVPEDLRRKIFQRLLAESENER